MLSLNFINRNKGEEKAGMLKGVFYGGKENSTSIFVDAIEFQKLYRNAGESSVISLVGEGKDLQALIQNVSYSPVKNLPIHTDFYIVEKGSTTDAEIPLEFVGVSEAVKSLGGTLVKVLHDVHVEAEATKLPHTIKVDLSLLKDLDSVIKIKDLDLGADVKVYRMEEDEIVASIATNKEEDLSTPVTADISNIEVAEKGKKEKED